MLYDSYMLARVVKRINRGRLLAIIRASTSVEMAWC